ncbi:hypothetical protein [Alkalihalobacillus pseudalcaliphilus]|uniref:hypothetical protein n=1 Tax=Alkalihalobacillus pseudalcaliphilus TaxID=79884 RepID=UPI00064DA9DA|nr:hypothetical protein [Alkalihalobacillus pseudalcaliphilus]KMK75855.1 hypothetical protein AB990_11370 [Alkalihalobacillus pseudalcaliphilus]
MAHKGKRKEYIKWGIAGLLVACVLLYSPYLVYFQYLSPENTLRYSEKSMHYGPSDIIDERKVNSSIIYLSTYKDWFSASHVERKWGIFWQHRNGGGIKKNSEEAITHIFGSSFKGEPAISYMGGYVSDPEIDVIEVELDHETLQEPVNDQQLFLVVWKGGRSYEVLRSYRGLNEEGDVLYEYEHPRMDNVRYFDEVE